MEPRPPFMEGLAKITSYGRAILALTSNYFFVRENVADINAACQIAGNFAGNDIKSRAEISKALLLREDKGSTLIVERRMIHLSRRRRGRQYGDCPACAA